MCHFLRPTETGCELRTRFWFGYSIIGGKPVIIDADTKAGKAGIKGEEEDEDSGLVILKVIHEDGEDLLSTLDSDEELDAVYELFMENLFDDEE